MCHYPKSLRKVKIARIWQGARPTQKPTNTKNTLFEAGIKKITETEGNLGVDDALFQKWDYGIHHRFVLGQPRRYQVLRGAKTLKAPSSPEGRGIFAGTAGVREKLRFNNERLDMNKDGLFD